MGHLLVVTDGTNSVSLAESLPGPGIKMISFQPPRARRSETRSDPVPGSYGQRTTSSTFVENTCSYVGRIYSDSENNVAQALRNLTRILQHVKATDDHGAGRVVVLRMARQGSTNYTVWKVTGVEMPQPTSADNVWDQETLNFQVTIRIEFRLEPLGHSDGVKLLQSATTFTNKPGSNYVVASVPTSGDVESPLRITVARTATQTWTEMLLAIIRSTPAVYTASVSSSGAAVDAAASNGYIASYTVPNATAVSTSYAVSQNLIFGTRTFSYPARIFVRLKCDQVAKLRVRLRVELGGTSGIIAYTPWVAPNALDNIFTLMDLGTSRHAAQLDQLTTITATSTVTYRLEYWSPDGTAITVKLDYIEVIWYLGLCRVSNMNMSTTRKFVYEDITIDGGNLVPAPFPSMYQLTSADVLTDAVTGVGGLGFVPANQTVTVWTAIRNTAGATAHDVADAGTIKIEHLPTYSTGIRGND